ncbi:MAG: NAD-dependent epimerase/dehydratase family protein, partial [Rhodothermales bacterium]|nr:NAD-dependent epimerase/dehydratase family protein [Rhodothermales bacterium]
MSDKEVLSGRGRKPDTELRSALLLGATGLVGSRCLEILLNRPDYSEVTVLTRRPLDRQHPHLRQHIVEDFDRLEEDAELNEWAYRVSDLYISFGTTIRKAGSQELFRRIDLDYPLVVARACANAGVGHAALVSSIAADATSRNFYLRTKGQLEDALLELPFATISIVRPSVILGERPDSRILERLGQA